MNSSNAHQSQHNERPRKLQRISQACDLCHRRSIRCRPSKEDQDRCQNCYDFDVSCTYDRPSKRRKHPQAPNAPQQSPAGASSASSSVTTKIGSISGPPTQPASAALSQSQFDLVNRERSGDPSDDAGTYLVARQNGPGKTDVSIAWKAFVLSCEPAINELLDIYMDVIYPLYPLFHLVTLKRRMRNRDHLTDRGFFSSVMGACALTSARVRDGAVPKPYSESLKHPEVATEIFFSASRDAISKDMTQNEGFDYLRACTLLALTSIQYGQLGAMQQYLGQFFTLAAMQRFYDEKFWRPNLSKVQKELRRRIYWCTYTLDVYSSAIWNCFLRSQEIHANVRYPSDTDDDTLENAQGKDKVGWLQGWNFATDLYRVLEHTLNKSRAKTFEHEDRRRVDSLLFQDTFSDERVLQTILQLYYQLPSVFKETPPMTGDRSKDIYGFQAANIQATMQLVRMILLSMEDGAGVERKCEVASEVLSVFHTIPREFLRAISTPLIYHLGTIGSVLGSAVENGLSESQYHRVTNSLLSMADLLESLETGLARAAGTSQNLRSQVDKITQHMQNNRKPQIPTSMQPPSWGPNQASNHEIPPLSIPNLNNIDNNYIMNGPADFQLPPELFGDWSWPLDAVQHNPYAYGSFE